MSRTLLPHAADNAECVPGTWCMVDKGDGEFTCEITCPLCKKASTVYRTFGTPPSKHTISDDGIIDPSVVCPHAGCTWHVWVQLKDWCLGRMPPLFGRKSNGV